MRVFGGLDELHRWVMNVNDALPTGQARYFNDATVNRVLNLISVTSENIRDEYSFYANVLPRISYVLFITLPNGVYELNSAAFGELFIIVRHLYLEPQDLSAWAAIHPRIAEIAKGLYLDGHYLSASERSIVEVEERLREVFCELKPDAAPPSKVGDLIGGLLSDKGAYHFCDTSTMSGKDYRRGIQLLFEGAFAAYRNPSAHGNSAISKDAAFDRIVLASQLMKVLDDVDK